MPRARSPFKVTRRRFAFWVGMGLFSLSERLRADGLDELAASVMKSTEGTVAPRKSERPEHWSLGENRTWRWFERENLVEGQWTITGVTTPVHKRTGQRYTGKTGYLDEALVPDEVRLGEIDLVSAIEIEQGHGRPDPVRKARHGRPPSKWLRSLEADELRIWLKTIDVPEFGVSGMTFWTHLTRDHSFNPAKIEGLTIPEQAKLHAAAHSGY